MLLNKSHRIVALLLTLLMLNSSTAFSIDLHYCKGDLKSFSLFGTAKSCHDAKKQCPMHPVSEKTADDDRGCCSNKKITFDQLDSDFTSPQLVELSKAQTVYLFAAIDHDVDDLFVDIHRIKHLYYRPPLPSSGLHILHQVFII